MRPLAKNNLIPSQCAARGKSGRTWAAKTAANSRRAPRKHGGGETPRKRHRTRARSGAKLLLCSKPQTKSCNSVKDLHALAGWSRWFAAGSWRCGPGRQPAEECAGGGRELDSGSDQDPDQGGGAQLCQELFTLTEHAAAHSLTPPPPPPPPLWLNPSHSGAFVSAHWLITDQRFIQVTPRLST